VALQLPESLAAGIPSGRLTDKFPSDTTIWLVLRKFESIGGTNLNFTARGATQLENGTTGAGRIFYEIPALNVSGRDVSTFPDLQKTLAQLGFNGGSCLIRLGFKVTNQPLEEAMAEIGKYFKDEEKSADSENKVEDAPPNNIDTLSDAIARLPSRSPEPAVEDVEMSTVDTSEGTSQDPTPYPERVGDASIAPPLTPNKIRALEIEEEAVLGPDQRPITVYSAPSNHTPQAALRPHNEDDYEPTIAHAKLHQSRLLNNTQNKRLLSDAETEQLEKEKAAKLAATKEVKIRIRFPDQTSVDATFKAQETGAQLYEYVTGLIVAESQPFKLVYTAGKGPQTVPKNENKLSKDLGFAGSVLVNFSWEDGANDAARKAAVLKPQFGQKAKELTVPEPPAVETNDEAEPPHKPLTAGGASAGGSAAKGGIGGAKSKLLSGLLKGLSKK
jgi:tether containing UBX domain for GLUT4